ncbi:MAG: hypothetical protein ACI808_000002 [Paraglaciecola sp.]|jgi:hypothetical protein
MRNLLFNKQTKYLLLTIGITILLILALTAVSIFSLNYIQPTGLMPVDNKQALVIDNVNIVMVKTNKVLKNRQVVINKGIITAINGARSPAQDNARIIDGNGAYVTPGLFDMHVHLYDRKYLMLNLAYGVTSVRNLNGKRMHLRWREELQNEQWLGSNLYLSSPILAGKDTHALNQKIPSPQEGREQVRKAKENGYDLVKVYGYLESEIFEAIIDEARKLDIAVAKHGPHSPKGSDWEYLEGLQSLEHVEDIFQGPLNYQFDYEKLQTIALQLKALNVPIVPTLETFKHLTQLSNGKQTFINSLDLDFLNPLHLDIESEFSVARWLQDEKQQSDYHSKELKFLFEIVNVLNDHKIKLLVGSDAGTMYTIPGVATHNEMYLLKQSGLSDFGVLKAATINAAQALKIDSQYGSVEIGKTADLVLVTQNPLEDIQALRNPAAVIKNGQWIDEKALAKLKIEAKNTDGYFWSVINLLEDLLTRAIF